MRFSTRIYIRTLSTNQSGFTLLEVMVATIILVIGVLGAAAMTITAIRNSQQSGSRSTAVALAYEVGEMIRAYPNQINSFINVGTNANPGTLSNACYGGGCTEANLALHDLYEWSHKVTDPRVLPNGNAYICRDRSNAASSTPSSPNCDNLATSPLVIKIWWAEKNGDGSISSPTLPSVTVTLLPA